MKITRRLYAYPVLAADKDDYVNSTFTVDMSENTDLNNLNLHFSIHMDSQTIDHLIGTGQARYLIHIECSSTAFRTAKQKSEKEFDVSIPLDKLNGTVELVAFIVTTKEIADFRSQEWNADFDGFSFDLEKGAVLAYQNLPNLEITKNIEQLIKQKSIFSVYKRAGSDAKGMNINADNDTILIGLQEEEYRIYAACSTKSTLQPILNAMTVFPAMVYILEELNLESNEVNGHDYTKYLWYKSLVRAFKSRGRDFTEFVEDNGRPAFEKAQELMEMPVGKALFAIRNFIDDTEGDA